MKYIKANYDKNDPAKFVVAYYNCDGRWSETFLKVDEALDSEEFRNRVCRAVLVMLGVPEVHPHRLIQDEFCSNSSNTVFYWIYLSEEEEDQVNAGKVTDAQVRELLTRPSRDASA